MQFQTVSSVFRQRGEKLFVILIFPPPSDKWRWTWWWGGEPRSVSEGLSGRQRSLEQAFVKNVLRDWQKFGRYVDVTLSNLLFVPFERLLILLLAPNSPCQQHQVALSNIRLLFVIWDPPTANRQDQNYFCSWVPKWQWLGLNSGLYSHKTSVPTFATTASKHFIHYAVTSRAMLDEQKREWIHWLFF